MYNYGRKEMRPTAATARRTECSSTEQSHSSIEWRKLAMTLLIGSAAMWAIIYLLTHGMYFALNGVWV